MKRGQMNENWKQKCALNLPCKKQFLAREPLDFYCRYDFFVLWCWP